jgi:hypothetical protein
VLIVTDVKEGYRCGQMDRSFITQHFPCPKRREVLMCISDVRKVIKGENVSQLVACDIQILQREAMYKRPERGDHVVAGNKAL